MVDIAASLCAWSFRHVQASASTKFSEMDIEHRHMPSLGLPFHFLEKVLFACGQKKLLFLCALPRLSEVPHRCLWNGSNDGHVGRKWTLTQTDLQSASASHRELHHVSRTSTAQLHDPAEDLTAVQVWWRDVSIVTSRQPQSSSRQGEVTVEMCVDLSVPRDELGAVGWWGRGVGHVGVPQCPQSVSNDSCSDGGSVNYALPQQWIRVRGNFLIHEWTQCKAFTEKVIVIIEVCIKSKILSVRD